jgi:hypothetical protein
MNRSQQLEVYVAQTRNLQELEKAWRHIKRGIHRDLVAQNLVAEKIQTKTLALIYCAWTEVAFSKLIHTPHCFELDEIRQIKVAGEKNGVTAAWEKCLALALKHVQSRKGSFVPNVKIELERMIEKYVEIPSQLRNKIAHGQWVVSLNRKNSGRNQALTTSLDEVDLVRLDSLKKGCEGLCRIVECLVESPRRAFFRDYWKLISEIKEELARTASFTREKKIALLNSKHRKAPDITRG